MGRFAVSCCVILWVIVRAPSDRSQGNLFLKSLIALKMHSPHLAGKKIVLKGQIPFFSCLSPCAEVRLLKKTVFSEFSTNRISVYSKVLLWYFYIAKAGKDCPIDQSHATGWEMKAGTISTFFTVVAVSWCNPGLFPAGQTRAHKKGQPSAEHLIQTKIQLKAKHWKDESIQKQVAALDLSRSPQHLTYFSRSMQWIFNHHINPKIKIITPEICIKVP